MNDRANFLKIRNELRQEQKQKLTTEQRWLLEEAKSSIGYIEYCINQRTRWEWDDGKIVKIIDSIHKDDEPTLDVYEGISKRF